MDGKRLAAAAGSLGLLVSLTGCWANGIHAVGAGSGKVAPGLYTSTRTLTDDQSGCVWERYRNGAKQGDDIEYGGRSFILIRPTDTGVFSDGCGVWDTPKPTSYNSFPTTMQYGAYRVNVDVRPGTYTAPGGKDCAWGRLSSFDGTTASYIARSYDHSKGYTPVYNPKVTIKSTDVGFITDPCGGWKRTGP